MKEIFLLILVSISLISVFAFSAKPEKAAAGRCAIPKFEKAFEQAGAVFVGKVLSRETEGGTKVFELEVEKYWKGVEDKKITVYVYENPRYQAQFKVGESYLVFAEAGDDGKFFDRRCSRTKSMENDFGDLKDDLKKLGKADAF
jgi:hypothetical protein